MISWFLLLVTSFGMLCWHASANDLAQLEKFVAPWSGVGCRDPSWTNATPACEWSIVSCVNNAVNKIEVQVTNCSGPVHLEHVPLSTQYLRLNYNYFNGSLDFPAINPGLLELTLTDNNFSGSMNLSSLHGTIIALEGNPGLCGSGMMNIECRDITLPNHCTCNYSKYDCGAC
jgi:hypothetical protein